MAYLPLSTANLPDPVIDPATGATPDQYFNTVLWTGDGTSSRPITGVGFQPDMVWTKRRSGADNHHLFDSGRVVSGVPQRLFPNLTNAEDGNFGSLDSFDSDGFTIGANTATNASGSTFVGWSWKANGSGVSNTDGTITSTVSANTTSGFSIVSYTGDGSTSHNVGHGLGVKPDMIIAKTRNASSTRWIVAHKDIPTTNRLVLDDTFASAADGDRISAYDTTTFTHNWNGANSNTFIAYCFHSVEGFSKIGSFTNNNSSDGVFVYCGFRPAWIMYKDITDYNWEIIDATRDSYNVTSKRLFPSGSFAESTGETPLDIVSNGFKFRDTYGGGNFSTNTTIFMAFAEQPFKYSNAR